MTQTPEHESPQARPRRVLTLPILLAFAALLGGIVGLGSYTVYYAKGTSYLTDDPGACANCHIMRPVYDAWHKSSHKAVAVCNDCHTPHTSIFAKYAVKAINGLNHSIAFTTDNFHEPIRITGMNRDVVGQNCLYCHGPMTALISHEGTDDPTDCLQCHARVGHDY